MGKKVFTKDGKTYSTSLRKKTGTGEVLGYAVVEVRPDPPHFLIGYSNGHFREPGECFPTPEAAIEAFEKL